MKTKNYVEYKSNNSGGSWWLSDKHWKKLEKSGWVVAWASLEYKYDESGDNVRLKNGLPKLVPIGTAGNRFPSLADRDKKGDWRSLGALATEAFRVGLPLREAAKEWEEITGLRSTDAGCACCGQPHYFTEYTPEGKYVASGPEAKHIAQWGEP